MSDRIVPAVITKQLKQRTIAWCRVCLSKTNRMQRYIILVCHMCLLRVFVFKTGTMQTYVTQCVTHPEQSSPHVSTIERSVGWTRGNQAVFRAQAMFAMFTTRPHTWFQWGCTHTRIAWATMDFATVRRPLVTPFWGLSIVEVINTYLHFVFLAFLLDSFSH